MTAFEVFLNGEPLCVAGIAGECVLDVTLSHVKRKVDGQELDLHVGGLVSAFGEHVSWTNVQLKTGDEIRVRVVESGSADEPKERKPRNPAQDLERQKHYVREMAKQLGWTLTETTL
jgi:hypothetical protein